MNGHWAGPAWGEPSGAASEIPPLRPVATAPGAAFRAEGGRSGDFLVLGTTVGGVSHRLVKRRCEDCYGWAEPSPGRLALVVADGVGSAGRGGEGADLAVSTVCRSLMGAPREWGPAQCLSAIGAAHLELLSAGGETASQLATTVVVALIEADGAIAKVTLGRVGDSSAFSLSAEGEWLELFVPSGTGASTDEAPRLLPGSTAVLPFGGAPKPVKGGVNASSREAGDGEARPGVRGGATSAGGEGPFAPELVEVVTVELPRGSALVLVTDGVAEPLRDGPTTVAPQLAQVLLRAPAGELSPLELARAADFSRRGAHDDRAVLAAWLIAGSRP